MDFGSVNTRPCESVRTRAEQELAAFFASVAEMFGAEQAELAAQDWLQELLAMEGLPASVREWRLLAVKASARLATRVNAQVEPPMGLPGHRFESADRTLCAAW